VSISAERRFKLFQEPGVAPTGSRLYRRLVTGGRARVPESDDICRASRRVLVLRLSLLDSTRKILLKYRMSTVPRIVVTPTGSRLYRRLATGPIIFCQAAR